MDPYKREGIIKIKVKLLNGRKAYMEVSLKNQVSSIREKLSEGKHLPLTGNYNLVFQGVILDNNKPIHSYFPLLTNDSEVMCVSRPDI